MKTRSSIRILALITISLLFHLPSTSADMGGIPINPGISIYEPGQKAIVAWNGQEEILILSTDVNASQDTPVIRVLPLPSNPKTIEKANFTSFTTIQSLLWKHAWRHTTYDELIEVTGLGGVEPVVVTFHEKIGAHDITVVKASNASELSRWVNEFLRENGVTEEVSLQEFEAVLEDYMSRGFPFFVLDLIDVSSQEKSVEPILYHFETDFLYYPLKISSLFSGSTKISLFLLTQGAIGGYIYHFRTTGIMGLPGLVPWGTLPVIVSSDKQTVLEDQTWAYVRPLNYTWLVGRPIQFNLTSDELRQVDPRVEDLFDDRALLTVLEYWGSLDLFTGDLILRHGEELIGYPFVPSPPVLIPYNYTVHTEEPINLTTVPTNLTTPTTIGNVTAPPADLTIVPIDYRPPAINLVTHSLGIDESKDSVVIHCNAEDKMSGVDTVILHYQAADGEWETVEMENVDGKFTATIPLQAFRNVNFYVEAFDQAGNRVIDDNNKAYYLIDVAAYTRTCIFQYLGIVALCTLTASAIALTTKTYVKKKLQ